MTLRDLAVGLANIFWPEQQRETVWDGVGMGGVVDDAVMRSGRGEVVERARRRVLFNRSFSQRAASGGSAARNS